MSQITATPQSQGLDENGRRRLVQVFITVLIYAVCLFIPAGTLRWPAAWAYLLLYLGSILTLGLYVARKHPEVVNERGRSSAETKPFDRLFGRLYIVAALGIYVVAGLDFRFGWSTMPLALQILGFVMQIPGAFMPYWVMLVNAHAATTVRVEVERGQTVVTTGPYAIVRHPMYSGMILSTLFFPLAMGSWWTYIPVIAAVGLVIWRTANEDRALHDELPGYRDYAAQTRYRLLPGVW